jgi:hypothetical protein
MNYLHEVLSKNGYITRQRKFLTESENQMLKNFREISYCRWTGKLHFRDNPSIMLTDKYSLLT